MRISVAADELTGARLGEILDAWFEASASGQEDDRANVAHLGEIG